jgi:hypothetical protein
MARADRCATAGHDAILQRGHGLCCWSAGVICGVGLWNWAVAAPPPGRAATVPYASNLVGPNALPARPARRPDPALAPIRLELGIPPTAPLPIALSDAAVRIGTFPSAIHHLVLARAELPPSEDRISAALARPALPFETRSPVQVLTRRIRNEGIPFAHLWRSRSAAVTIGLNARAKPGIWLFQTSH